MRCSKLEWLVAIGFVLSISAKSSSGENVAVGKSVSQSGTYAERVASRAVDNNTSFNIDLCATADIDNYDGDKTFAWWQVDLDGYYYVTSVTMFNTGISVDYDYEVYFTIRVGNSTEQNMDSNPVCYKYDVNIPVQPGGVTFNCTTPIVGRYVSIKHHKLNDTVAKKLTLCEVQVEGVKSGELPPTSATPVPPTSTTTVPVTAMMKSTMLLNTSSLNNITLLASSATTSSINNCKNDVTAYMIAVIVLAACLGVSLICNLAMMCCLGQLKKRLEKNASQEQDTDKRHTELSNQRSKQAKLNTYAVNATKIDEEHKQQQQQQQEQQQQQQQHHQQQQQQQQHDQDGDYEDFYTEVLPNEYGNVNAQYLNNAGQYQEDSMYYNASEIK